MKSGQAACENGGLHGGRDSCHDLAVYDTMKSVHCFGGTSATIFIFTLKMEAVCSSETLVTICQISQSLFICLSEVYLMTPSVSQNVGHNDRVVSE
jgi:hypothetical protein